MIALIDYEMGNLLSVSKALEKVGGQIKIVKRPEEIKKASALILPGVGNFGDGMGNLIKIGFDAAIIDFIRSGRPFLGICIGMQLLMEKSEEAPGVKGLGVFPGDVIKFPKSNLKVPHMGWNNVKVVDKNINFSGIPDNSFFYFVHSYFVNPKNKNIIAGNCGYGVDFPACIGFENIFATQFHPEKSQEAGLRILKNWISGVKK